MSKKLWERVKKYNIPHVLTAIATVLIILAGCKVHLEVHQDEAATLTGITLDTSAVKTEYTIGDEFTAEGLVVTATYSDGKTKEVEEWTYDGFNSSQAVTNQTITISYTENNITVTATYNISIDETVLTDFIEIQNKRETVYNYYENEKPTLYPVKFLLDDGNATPVEFGEGVTIDTYTTGGNLPDPSTITNIPEGLEFWDWAYQKGEKKIKITKLPENTDGQVVVYARYGTSVTNAEDLQNSLENDVKSFKITPKDKYEWELMLEEIETEDITVILDLTNVTLDENKISWGYFSNGGSFTPTVTEIVIPATIIAIGQDAFGVCRNLQKIDIPADVTSIGDEAFAYCYKLTDIEYLAENPNINIGEDAFKNVPNQ